MVNHVSDKDKEKIGDHKPAGDKPEETNKSKKIVGSLDLGYNLLAQAAAAKRPDSDVKAPRSADVDKAIDAAQAWTVPTPHSQDLRYSLPGRAELLRQLAALRDSMPEEKKDK